MSVHRTMHVCEVANQALKVSKVNNLIYIYIYIYICLLNKNI